MSRRFVALMVALITLLSIAVSQADIPRLITYQGRLTDDTGEPVPDGTYDVNFAVYDDSTSGSLLWGEIQAVTTINGLFNVQLGLHTSLDETIFIDYADVFIGLQLSGEPEMSPRIRLTSNAFCYQALHADLANYALAAIVGGGWRDDGTTIRLDNEFDSVGIGTSTPAVKLEVVGDAMIRGKTTFGSNQTNIGDGATITGGADNIAEGIVSTISGGQANLATGDGSTICGGAGNQATNNGSTVGGGYFNYARGRSSVIGGGGNIGVPTDSNSASGDYSVIGGGHRNIASGYLSVVSGGDLNFASKQLAVIGGGAENIGNGNSSTIAGGQFNHTYGDVSTIGGGGYNRAHGYYSVIAGGGGTFTGDSNSALGSYSAILGGRANTAAGLAAIIGGGENNSTNGNNTVIGGGLSNQALATSATIGGGDTHIADGIRSTIAGGGVNHAGGSGSAIVGGTFNRASGEHAFIGGGGKNVARGAYSVVAGGGGPNIADSNSATGENATIGGGAGNMAGGQYAVISGGGGNSTDGEGAMVGGGIRNDATAYYTTIAGGYFNSATMTYASIGGGSNNEANGDGATVPGGANNIADGSKSFAAGYRAKALHDGTFVWADNTEADFQSTGANKFLIRASGGVGIGTISPGAMLDVADDDRALRLRAGNGQAEFADHQILLSYGGTVNYSHAIKSRHSGSTSARNAIDFYVWDQATDAVTDVGTKHVMTIDGDGDGEVGIGTTEPSCMLDVRGTICNNTVIHHSDRRWKTNIETIPNALEKVTALRGVNFKWRQDEYTEMNFPNGKHLGVIAQEVESVLPELVNTAEDGYKSVEYANLTALLIEAVKQQQQMITELKSQVAELTRQSQPGGND